MITNQRGYVRFGWVRTLMHRFRRLLRAGNFRLCMAGFVTRMFLSFESFDCFLIDQDQYWQTKNVTFRNEFFFNGPFFLQWKWHTILCLSISLSFYLLRGLSHGCKTLYFQVRSCNSPLMHPGFISRFYMFSCSNHKFRILPLGLMLHWNWNHLLFCMDL